jgi:hypothetical protein
LAKLKVERLPSIANGCPLKTTKKWGRTVNSIGQESMLRQDGLNHIPCLSSGGDRPYPREALSLIKCNKIYQPSPHPKQAFVYIYSL